MATKQTRKTTPNPTQAKETKARKPAKAREPSGAPSIVLAWMGTDQSLSSYTTWPAGSWPYVGGMVY